MRTVRRIASPAAIAAFIALVLPLQSFGQGEQEGPPPELLLSNADGFYVTATDKKNTGAGDPTEDFKQALEYYHKYLEAAPGIAVSDSARIYWNIADCHVGLNEFGESVPYYLWLIDREPEGFPLSSSYVLAGYALWQTQGLDAALPYYLKYVELVPDDLPQRKVVARALYSQHKYGEALPHYMYLLEQTPEDQDMIDALLTIRNRMMLEYEKITLKLAEKRPDTPKYLLDLGEYYLNQLEVEKAIGYLQQYTQKRADDVTGWARLADAYRSTNDISQAMNALRKIKSIDPRNVQARAEIAAIQLDQGQINAAINELKGALRIDAESAQANAIMGDAGRAWALEYMNEQYPGRALEKMPYNLKKVFEDKIKVYYEKARRDPEWRNHAINQLNYISQFYPTSSDNFMAPPEEKVPIQFPPPA